MSVDVDEHPLHERALPILVAVAVGLVAFAVYLLTLNPTLPPGDSGDLITAASTLGIAHPPGYPLFALVGHLFTLLPFETPAFRVNVMSAALDAAAVAVVVFLTSRIAVDVAGGHRGSRELVVLPVLAGAIGGAFLAFSTEFWAYSLVAEVFALNNLFAATLLLLAYGWFRTPERRSLFWAFFLVSGLAFCNQQTIALLAPGLGVFLIGGVSKLRANGGSWVADFSRTSAIGLLLMVVGLLPYLYLPLAAAGHPPAMWGDPSTLERFIAVVTRADYGSFSLVGGGQRGDAGANLAAFAGYLIEAFGVAGCLLAAGGLAWLVRRGSIIALALGLSFIIPGPLFLAFASPPLGGLLGGIFARFYILPSVPFALFIGCGAYKSILVMLDVISTLPRSSSRSVRVAMATTVAVAFGAIVVLAVVARYPAVDQSGNRTTMNFVEDLLTPLDQGSILLTEGDTAVLGTWYAQNVERYRADVVVIAVPLLRFQWYIDELRRQHPDVVIPFESADVIGHPVTEKIVDANFGRRSLYYVGVIAEAFPAGYGELRTGFARKFVAAGAAGDAFSYVREHLRVLEGYRYPQRKFPVTTWENWESTYYGNAAFDLANAYETSDVAVAERWYRTAIELAPGSPAAYKDLAILLSANNRRPSEVADLLENYLLRAPQDPEAVTIRASIERIRSAAP